MRTLELLLLGPFQARRGGRLLPTLPQKGRALVAYLATQEGPVPREQLAALLWDAPEPRARANLRQTLYRLRQGPLAPHLEETARGLALVHAESDWRRFWRLYQKGALQEALKLVRGAFLEDLPLSRATGFEDWRYLEQERLVEARIRAHLQLAEAQATRAPEAAIGHLVRVLELDPLFEPGYRRLFALLTRLGRGQEAAYWYARLRRALHQQLGLLPEEETEKSYRAALAGKVREPAPKQPPPDLEHPPLVGRQSMLATLEKTRDPLIWLHGPEGVGKTRLAQALVGKDGVWIRFEAGLSRLDFAALSETLRERIKRIKTLDPEIRAELARLLPELGPPMTTPLTGGEPRLRFFEALVQALLPAGWIVLDAMENADPGFWALLPYLARRARGLGVRILATATTPPPPSPAFRAIAVPPLDADATRELIQGLGAGEASGALARKLYKTSGGNPGILLEVLKDLFASQVLIATPGGWQGQARRPLEAIEPRLPENAEELLSRRWRRLSPEAARATRLALVARTPIDAERVALALGMPEETAAAALLEALEAGLLKSVRGGYWPRFPGLAAGLPRSLKETLHRRLAAALEAQGGPALFIAEHLAAGGRKEAAGRAYLEAARAAEKGPHPSAAVVLYHRAERHLRLLPLEAYALRLRRLELETDLGRDVFSELTALGPPPQPAPTLEARWRLTRAEAALKKGQFQVARAEATRVLAQGPAPEHQARARYLLAWVEYRAGDPDAQRAHLEAALAAFLASGDRTRACRVRRNLAALAFRLGQHEEGLLHQNTVLKTLETHPDPVTRRRVWADRLTGQWLHRDFYGAREGARELLEEARRAADLSAQMDALEIIGLAEWKMGRPGAARSAFEQGLELARAVDSPREMALFLSERALAEIDLGELKAARQDLSRALRLMRQIEDKAKIGHVYTAFGLLELAANDPAAARPWLKRAVRHWYRRGEKGHAARALALYALALEAQQPAAARALAKTARRLAEAWRTGVPERSLILAVYARFFPEARAEARAVFQEEARRLPPALRPAHRRTLAGRLLY